LFRGGRGLTEEQTPSFFFLSLYDDVFVEIQKEVEILAERFPKAHIFIGGPSVNTCHNLKELSTFFPKATALVRGDGEKVAVELVRAFSQEMVDYDCIKKLRGVYVKHEEFEHYDNGVNILKVDELEAQPGIVLYDQLIKDIKKVGGLSLHTSRGCKYRCIFCSFQYHDLAIYWSADRIIQELNRIKEFILKGELPEEAKNILFTDDDFFQNRDRAIEFYEKLNNTPGLRDFFNFGYFASIGSFFQKGELDNELIDLLLRDGEDLISFGTDGFSQAALRAMRKGGYNWQMALNLMEALFSKKIPQAHAVILTYPEIIRDKLLEVLRNIDRLLESYAVDGLFSVQAGYTFLCAYESNGLMTIAEERREPKIVTSSTGAVKKLPITAHLFDEELEIDLRGSLNKRYPWVKMRSEILAFADPSSQREAIDLIIEDLTDSAD